MGRRRVESEGRERVGALLGQPRIRGKELPASLENALGQIRSGSEVLHHLDYEHLRYIPADLQRHDDWVHVLTTSGRVISFHHLGDGKLSVHSDRPLDWEKLSWLTFSTAHAMAIEAWESGLRKGNRVRKGAIDTMRRQTFTPEDFHVGYGEDGSSPTALQSMWNRHGTGILVGISFAGLFALGLTHHPTAASSYPGMVGEPDSAMASDAASMAFMDRVLDFLSLLSWEIFDLFLAISFLFLHLLALVAPVALMVFMVVHAFGSGVRRWRSRIWDEHYELFLPGESPSTTPQLGRGKNLVFSPESHKTRHSAKKSPLKASRASASSPALPPRNHQRARR